ncbi:HAD hydrolase-like protein [Butyrivibrio sp. NC2002]|uniref:HAD hydrolase-like protein n=1 Tax=Butyrivibrio sp. NC2002 TaxID=1410610 RepID=UPI000569B128|nr:HAD hydrolase-like protein [Butyrivibrio sp. NC2002]
MKKVQIYSFDIFETLVNRIVVHPYCIFKLMVSVAKEKKILLPDNFSDKRILAEKKARAADEYYNIFDIYSFINDISVSKEILIDLEFETELRYAFVNREMKKRLEQLRQKGEEVCIISDMYWPKEYLDKYLSYFGIVDYIDLFCSCDCKASKYDGSLFKFVLRTLKIKSSQLVHIGDNYRSDFLIPRLMGIKAHLFNQEHNYDKYYLSRKEDYIESDISDSKFICCTCDIKESREYQLGYSLFGPVLYEFANWIDGKRKQYGISKLFFLSRDGMIIKKAYDLLYPDSYTSYFYASRKALIIPTLHYYNTYAEISNCFFVSGRETNIELLDKLGVDSRILQNNENGKQDREKISNCNISDLYELFKEDINKNSIIQEKFLKDYLLKQGLTENSLIIDIGWFGNMQYSLEKIINGNRGILKGVYLGIVPYSERVVSKEIAAEGFLFGRGKEKFYQVVKSAIAFFEFFFTAEHGTVNGYSKDLTPILGKEELLKTNEVDERYVHSELQRGAIDYVLKRKLYIDSVHREASSSIAIKNIENFLNNPRLDDISILKDIAISRSKGTVRKMVSARSFFYYCSHFKDFINDFNQAGIKTAFFKEIFKIEMPYLDYYLLMRKVLGKGKK